MQGTGLVLQGAIETRAQLSRQIEALQTVHVILSCRANDFKYDSISEFGDHEIHSRNLRTGDLERTFP